MIERIVPPEVVTAEAFSDVPESLMLPAEAELVATAVPARRREFGTVRHCARRALGELGVPARALLPGEHREPLWPPGIVGAMTHCTGYRAVAVARADIVHGIGIDAEPHAALPPGVLRRVARDDELTPLAALSDRDDRVHWERLLFSAKESTYKLWFPLTGCWLGFEDASVRLDLDGGFSVRLVGTTLRVAGRKIGELTGRWLVRDDLLLTAITLPVGEGCGRFRTG